MLKCVPKCLAEAAESAEIVVAQLSEPTKRKQVRDLFHQRKQVRDLFHQGKQLRELFHFE